MADFYTRFQTWPSLSRRWSPNAIWVAAHFTVTGTHQGEFMGAAPTGKKITVHGIDMIRIIGGKVVEATHYGDEMIALMKLGVRPPV